MNEQIEKLLKEVEELKENQKKMTKKMDKMQQIIDQIQEDIYEFGDPYEDEEIVVDVQVVKIQKNRNKIEH